MVTPVYLSRDVRPMTAQEPSIGERNGWFYRIPGVSRDEALATLGMVEAWSRKHFDDAVTMQRTPTGYGIQLLLHSLPEKVQYEPVPNGIMNLLHGAVPLPHRVEYFQRGAKGVEHDARVAYLAHCRHVPVYFHQIAGDFIHDSNTDNRSDFYEQHRQGWYKCDITVPANWRYIGLVPDTFHKIMIGEQPTYIYPHADNEEFTSWLHESEVKLLIENHWKFAIRERVLFATEQKGMRGLDPLRKWSDLLSEGIMGAEAKYRETHDKRWHLMRLALRSVALQTIGQFMYNGQGRIEYEVKDGQVIGHMPKDITPYLARYHHPEWFAAITARTRVATTRIALMVPRAELIAIKADAVVSKYPIAGLADKGQIGAYRCKGAA